MHSAKKYNMILLKTSNRTDLILIGT